MSEITTSEVREYLLKIQGREVELNKLRDDLNVDRHSKSWDAVRNIMFQLAEQKLVKPSGRRDGIWRVIPQVSPVRVFGTNHKSETFDLVFPRDFETGMEIELAENIVVRGGDLILIAGVSNYGKTSLAMNFLAENIDKHKCVLMGNEYTTSDGKPTPRFMERLKAIDWVDWVNENGDDKFTLLPVMSDFAEYVQKDKLNIIDWINIDTGEHYLIGNILRDIKSAVGNGIAIAVIQKSEVSDSGRGGQFTKDFADVELLVDQHGEMESRLTVGKVKEYTKRVIGRSWAYGIFDKGVKILHIREVKKCPDCHGFKFVKGKGACGTCRAVGWIDK